MTAARDWSAVAAQTFEEACLEALRHEDDEDPMGRFTADLNQFFARRLLERAAQDAVKEAMQ